MLLHVCGQMSGSSLLRWLTVEPQVVVGVWRLLNSQPSPMTAVGTELVSAPIVPDHRAPSVQPQFASDVLNHAHWRLHASRSNLKIRPARATRTEGKAATHRRAQRCPDLGRSGKRSLGPVKPNEG